MANFELKPFEHASSFRRIAAVAWPAPTDPTIYGALEVRAERLLEWVDLKRRETGERVTVTHAVARALAILFRRYPDVNAVVRWGRPQLRKNVDVFCQVAIPIEGSLGKADLSGVCVRQADTKDIAAIAQELRAGAAKIRSNQDENFERTKGQAMSLPGVILGPLLRMLRFLQIELNLNTKLLGAPPDPFGSVMVTSLGMMGIREAWAPFFPLGSCSMLVLVGAIEERPVVEDGQLAVGKVLRLNGTFDHRIVDGAQTAVLARELRILLEDPRRLELEGDRSGSLGEALPTADLESIDLDPMREEPDSETQETPTQVS